MHEFDIRIIDDPAIFKVNTLPAHSDTFIFGNEEELEAHRTDLILKPEDSSLQMSLDGLWHFNYAQNPGLAVKGFEKEDFDVSGWDRIHVPSNIQFEGYDQPAYVNSQYPWDGRENLKLGEAPKRFNPTAQYVRFFTLPDHWRGMGVRASFKGVESGFALWLNGQYVGYSEDSFTPSDFDLTPFIKEGENRIAVLDFKFVNGSWFEDQDMYRLSGIFRSVILQAVPKAHVEDVRITADPGSGLKDGIIDARIKVSGGTDGIKLGWKLTELGCAGPSESDVVKIRGLSDGSAARPGSGEALPEKAVFECDRVIASGIAGRDNMPAETVTEGVADQEAAASAGSWETDSFSISVSVPDVKKWSAEAPNLYELQIFLLDKDGNVIEAASELAGFRHFDLKDGLMRLNGKRIVFNGTDRHEFSCDTGRSPRPEYELTDVTIMKRNNINAIRTSHYPNDSMLYRLCDIYGLYLIAENNMETHGTWCFPDCRPENYLPDNNEDYLEMMLDRVRSCYHRDKNHPSIIIWSCGNESRGGSVIYRMSQEFRKLDSTRLVHYEGIFHDRTYNDTSDMESQMYTPAAEVEKFLEEHPEKPFILCEYTHSMGNSNGGMHRYIELSERNPRYQGGFIWDFVDQAVRRKNRYGEDYLAYGGDCGERPTDYDFSGNGIVDATRRPYGKIQEIKYNYRTIKAEVSEKTFTVTNKNLFTNTDCFDCVITAEHEGQILAKESVPVSVEPLSEKIFPLPDSITDAVAGCDGECAVTVSFALKEDTLWADRGYETAFGQGIFNGAPSPDSDTALYKKMKDPLSLRPSCGSSACAGVEKLEIIKGALNLGVRGENFDVLFSGHKGGLVSYRYGGVELVKHIPRPNFWRAPISNDNGNRMQARLGVWKLASEYQVFSDPERGIFDIGNDPENRYPKIQVTGDYVEIAWKKYLPVLLTDSAAGSGTSASTGCQTMDSGNFNAPEQGGGAKEKCVHCLTKYRVFADGTVRFILEYTPEAALPPMPEFGWLFGVDADYRHVTYYGLGPEENYCDRRMGARLGVYSRDARGMVERYLVPQETGNRTGVRWAKVTDDRGCGIMLRAAQFPESGDPEASRPGTMEFSAIPYSPSMLENAGHPYELPPVHSTYIKCSLKQMGVAGDDSWGARPHPEYMLPADRKLIFAVDVRGINK